MTKTKKPKSADIICPTCGESTPFAEHTLTEGAILKCPNCGAEFGLTATLKRLPGEGELEPGGEAPSDELADLAGLDSEELPPEEPGEEEPDEEEPGDEEEEEPDDEEEEEPEDEKGKKRKKKGQESIIKRTPIVETKVLVCSDCHLKWLDSFAEKCPDPACGSHTVMVSTETITERITSAVKEIGNGVPTARVVDRMLGRFETPKG